MPSISDYRLFKSYGGVNGCSLLDIPLSKFTKIINASVDDSNVQAPLGFTLNFDNENYTTCNVSSNGFIQLFGDQTTLLSVSGSSTNNLSQPNLHDPILAPWWNNLITADSTQNGGVYWLNTNYGIDGQNVTVFRWICYSFNNQTLGTNRLLTFDLVLRNPTNIIEFRYAPFAIAGSPSDSSDTASVGICGKDRIGGTNRFREFLLDDYFLGGSVANTVAAIPSSNWPGTVAQFQNVFFVFSPPQPKKSTVTIF